MKKSIVTVLGITLSALAGVITSCTNDEVIASAERHGGKVGFGFSVEQMEGDGAVNTRAAAIVSQVMDGSGDSPVYLTTATTGYVNSRISGSSAATKGVSIENAESFYDNFGLFIYEYDASSDWSSAASTATPAKNNQKMLKSNGWITDKYWPGNQKKLTFFAYAPHSDNLSTYLTVNTTTGAPTLSYTVPATVSEQKDLLVTKHSDTHPTQDIQGDKNQVVNMAFYHALTAVQFKIGGTMAPCTIKTITVEGVNSNGTYNFSDDSWTGQSTTATYTISPNYVVNNSGKNNIFTNTSDMLMLLMPQTLPAEAKITITINDGQERTLTLPINGQVWQAGHSVTYTLSTASEDDTYQISVSVTSAPNEAGGDAKYSVSSYRQTYYGTQIPVVWTATYRVDEEENEQNTTGEFVTAFTASTDNPSNTSTDVTATLDKLYFVSDAESNTITSQLRAKNEVKYTDGSHYNLSNSSGAADIENTANCYIVNAPGYYRIPMVYGNGIKNSTTNSESISKSATFVNSAGTQITDPYLKNMSQTPANAVLVWQDAYHLIDPKSVAIKGDFIEFYIPKKYICEGNAVLAARDENNNILWSWHIWVTGETIGTSSNVAIKNRANTTYNFMKLPLGFCHIDTRKYPTRKVYVTITQNEGTNNVKKQATATIEQSSATTQPLGVNAPYYQYGRKDPFCPSNGNGNTNKTLYDSQIGVTDFKSQREAVGTNVSIQNPHIFYYVQDSHWNNSDSYEFWDVGNSDNGLYDAATHKSVKSVYDPSPVGYKTPEPAAWTNFTTTGEWTNEFANFNVSNTQSDYTQDGGWKFYTQAITTGESYLWHALGFRDVHVDDGRDGTGGLLYVGSGGYYWSCGPSTTSTFGRYLAFHSGSVYPQSGSYRANGFSVRPVSEQ